MRIQQVIPIAGNQIVMPLPQEFRGQKTLVVTLEDEAETAQESYEEEMKRAMQDSRFVADMHEVTDDFKFLDSQDIHE